MNVPIICAGQLVFPGDVIVADDDGVCIVARSEANDSLAASHARIAMEEEKRVQLAAGELGLDLYNMRERLDDVGFRYVETLDELGRFNGIDCKNKG